MSYIPLRGVIFGKAELYSTSSSYGINYKKISTTLIARLEYHFATCGKISHKPIGLYITVCDSKQYNSTRDPHGKY